MISDKRNTIYLNINNQKIPIWIYGENNKTLIYFIHGYFRGFSEYVGDLPPRYLMKEYRLVAFDLPGYGYSKKIKLDEVDFIQCVIRNTAMKKSFYLFGVSYGGLLSLKYIRKYPKNVSGIIIAGLPYFYGYRKLIGIVKYIPIFRKRKLVNIINKILDLNEFNFKFIEVPVLLLYSTKDSYGTSGMGKELNKKLKNSTLFLIHKYKHNWFLHDIKKSGFLSAIDNFVKS